MVWYAAEPVVEQDMPRALGLAADVELPHLFAFTVQRIAAVGTPDALRVLTDRLGRTTDVESSSRGSAASADRQRASSRRTRKQVAS